MNVLVFGAAGATGRLVVSDALAAGHSVTAFVRSESSRPADGVRSILGDALDGVAVAAAIAGHDAVISTLGVRGSFGSGGLVERSLGAIVPAMERHGARRLIVVSALGVGETRRQAPWRARILYALLLREIYRDKAAGERRVEASALDWTIVHPSLLTDGPPTNSCRAGVTIELRGFPRVARADVAQFVVTALASGRWSRQHVIVSS